MKFERLYNVSKYDVSERYYGYHLEQLKRIIDENHKWWIETYKKEGNGHYDIYNWDKLVSINADVYLIYITFNIIFERGDVFYRNSTTCYYNEYCNILFAKVSNIIPHYNEKLNRELANKIFNCAILYDNEFYPIRKVLVRGKIKTFLFSCLNIRI